MSEHIHEQISAFLDDELSAEESAFLVRRLASDNLAHRQTIRYAAIGSVLRDESLLANSDVLRDRIHAVLDGAPVTQRVTRSQTDRPTRWARLLAGASVAASVAIVAVLGLRNLSDTSVDTQTAASAAGGWTEPDSYVVPVESAPSVPVVSAPPMRLTNYLMQHGAFTSNFNRTSVQSTVIWEHDDESAEQVVEEVQVP